MNVTEEKDSDELKHIEARLESVELDNDVDDENERRLVKKIDRRILPIACLMYLFACTSVSRSLFVQGLNCDNIQSLTAPTWAMLASKAFLRTPSTETRLVSSLTGSHPPFISLTCVTRYSPFLLLEYQVLK